MSGLFEQTRDMRLNHATTLSRLPSKFRLNLGCDLNGDSHKHLQ